MSTNPEPFRVRMKVWKNPANGLPYLAPVGMMKAIDSDLMRVYVMRDDDTQLIEMTGSEWNEMPFFYFKEDGLAPRASGRKPDVVRL